MCEEGVEMSGNKRVLLLNGPNLNLLGKREPEVYGTQTLNEVVSNLTNLAESMEIELSHKQSNSEAELISAIHDVMGNIDFIIFNPAAFTHTSIALRDALLGVNIPFIEIHISNVHAREEFRHKSYLSDIAEGVICGLGTEGYEFALRRVASVLNK